ncbi:MAG TPA: AarF/UbiB family protein [Candidatus Binataceae bacterium]|jgi:predicted unusual protein kinase regulating ubiquinone biosynthesis (AarF/ABC1/UbiB family)|nr:AarF/UbiB family protein [Candidatus Binataceae bacterium]
MSEKPRKAITSGRTRRAVKIGGLVSQVSSSYLWTSLRKPFLDHDRHERELLETHIRNARRIVESSKQLRGAFMKLVQMLSMRDDLLPAEAIDLLKTTRAGVPPMDYAMIAQQVRRELGKRPEQLFSGFEPTAFAAASLGQVHRARLRTGEEVAVKVQYPGIDATVRQDLGNLKLLLRTLQAIAGDLMRQKIDTRTIYKELEERLVEELDYRIEARNTMEFHRLYADDAEVMVPRVFSDLSSRRVLTMTYLDGYHLSDLMNPVADFELRKWVARKYYSLIWRQLLEFGVLHTDPHPGNYLVTHHPRICILDFGSIRHYSEAIRRAHLQFARALVAGDDRAIGQAMVKLGYLDRDQDPRPMVEAIHIMFEPILVDRPYGPEEYDMIGKAAQVGEIAFRHKLYKSPAHGIFTARALVGLDGIMRGLGVRANYHRWFAECVARVRN